MELKRCHRCRIEKPREDFRLRRSTKDGLHSYCKPCHVESVQEWREKNRERRKAADRSRYAANRDRIRAYMRDWDRSNRDAAKAHNFNRNHRRRSLIASVTGSSTKQERDVLRASYLGICAYCSSPATTFDHVVSLSRGGSNGIENLTPACRPCNSAKRERSLLQFLMMRKAA